MTRFMKASSIFVIDLGFRLSIFPKFLGNMRRFAITIASVAIPALSHAADPIRFIDVDTWDAGLDQNIRIADWDGPERPGRALCDAEAELHRLGTSYARELVEKASEVIVEVVPQRRCGFDRYCGDLRLDGISYKETMIAAGYLKPWSHKGEEAQKEKPGWCDED